MKKEKTCPDLQFYLANPDPQITRYRYFSQYTGISTASSSINCLPPVNCWGTSTERSRKGSCFLLVVRQLRQVTSDCSVPPNTLVTMEGDLTRLAAFTTSSVRSSDRKRPGRLTPLPSAADSRGNGAPPSRWPGTETLARWLTSPRSLSAPWGPSSAPPSQWCHRQRCGGWRSAPPCSTSSDVRGRAERWEYCRTPQCCSGFAAQSS